MTNQELLTLDRALHENLVTEQKKKPKTLLDRISNALMQEYPLLSPELLERRREVTLEVPERLLKKAGVLFDKTRLEADVEDKYSEEHTLLFHYNAADRTVLLSATVPMVFDAGLEQKLVVYTKVGSIRVILKDNYTISDDIYLKAKERHAIQLGFLGKRSVMLRIGNIYQPRREYGFTASLDAQLTWLSSPVFDVGAETPAVPVNLSELSANIQKRYFEIVDKLVRANLDYQLEATKLGSPQVHVLWIPGDDALIPDPSNAVKDLAVPKKDLALALVLSNGKGKHYHVFGVREGQKNYAAANYLDLHSK